MECSVQSSLLNIKSHTRAILHNAGLLRDPLDEEQEKTRKQKQRYERVLKNLHSKEDDSSKFFSDFNPMRDRKTKKLRVRKRPRRKEVEKMNSKREEEVSEKPV